jgi:ankyrin repeat protein
MFTYSEARMSNNFKRVFLLVLITLLAKTAGCTLTPHHAIAQNNLKYLESKSSAELEEGVFGNDWLPVHVAASQGNIQALNILVRKGVDLNKLTYFGPHSNGASPLHLAIANHQVEAVKYLINVGASVDIKNTQGVAPIEVAVMLDSFELTKVLLASEADPNTINDNGVTPLMLAVQRNKLPIVQILVDAGANIDTPTSGSIISTPLIESIATDSVEVEITKFLISQGADLNLASFKGETALHYAVAKNNYSKVNLLISKGAALDVLSSDQLSPLHIATINRNKSLVETLLINGANPNILGLNQTTPIQEAAFANNNDVVNLLIKAGADVNHRNVNGFTAIHFAAFKQYTDIIKTLIDAGADKSILAEINESIRKQQVEQEIAQQRAQAEANANAQANNNLWVTALLGVMNVAANTTYPTSTYRPAPISYAPVRAPLNSSSYSPVPKVSSTPLEISRSQNSATPSLGCNSDFECGMGKKCVKGPLQSQGQCLTPVNQYGLPQPRVIPDPNSIRINTNTTGACQFDTQCGVGFRCDQTLKACVR